MWTENSGATATEYAFVVAFIAIVAAASMTVLGGLRHRRSARATGNFCGILVEIPGRPQPSHACTYNNDVSFAMAGPCRRHIIPPGMQVGSMLHEVAN